MFSFKQQTAYERRISDWSSDVCSADLPEVHPEARDAAADLDNLKRKIDAGASRAITQFFFDPDAYLRFVARARAAGIKAPIVPGVLPLVNFERTRQMPASCNAPLPHGLVALFTHPEKDRATERAAGRE